MRESRPEPRRSVTLNNALNPRKDIRHVNEPRRCVSSAASACDETADSNERHSSVDLRYQWPTAVTLLNEKNKM